MRTVHRPVSLIKAPLELGAGRQGSSLGPEAILQAGLMRQLNQLPLDLNSDITVPMLKTFGTPPNPKLKNLQDVLRFNTKLASTVSRTVKAGAFPLVLGGDHSIAIGTVAGLADHYRNMGLIWFDAHADLNTAETSPSGNIHGMPLAVCLGIGERSLVAVNGFAPKIKPEYTVIIGARQLDDGEKELIRKLGIACYTMHDIDRLGMARIMEEALQIVETGTDGLHISFDVDCLDPSVAPGTGTPVPGGLSYREAHLALELLYESGLVQSAEFVEVNPALDINNRTSRTAVELIGSLLGKTIL